MKKLASIFAIAFLMTLSINVFAQADDASVTANATARIVSPIAITKSGDLAFGKIAASTSNGTVTLSNAGVRTHTGGVSLIASTIGITTFTVTGEIGAVYAISLPEEITVKTSDNLNTMTIDEFNHSIGGTPTLTAGEEEFTVGATLNVSGGQVSGDYSGTYEVTVAYN